jgi:acyl-CoA synthetase (AMP-forming)/AMP-acid ligase II
MAIIKLAPGCSHRENDIIEFLQIHGVEKGKITKWMLPKLIAFSDDIPKTSVGKYNKREIKKQLDKFLALAREM